MGGEVVWCAVVCGFWYVVSGIEAYGSFAAAPSGAFAQDDSEDWASSM